jgi:hypothetical protein
LPYLSLKIRTAKVSEKSRNQTVLRKISAGISEFQKTLILNEKS